MKHRTSQSSFPRLSEATADPCTWTPRARTTPSIGQNHNEDRSREFVVLLHGLFATRRSMNTLARTLKASSYQVINWGYPTFLRNTEQHVERLLKTVRVLQEDPNVRAIHFVTHSMGGILARGVLQYGSGNKVHRLVMLAPPNTGSKLTRFPLGPFAWCCPAIVDLSESPNSLPNRMNQTRNAQIGIIAAERDFVVPLSNTMLSGQRDHCVIPTTHFRIPRQEAALQQVLNFLANGSFSDSRTTLRAA